MNKKHKKHTNLIKQQRGTYHPIEWAIYGTHCKGISEMFDQLKEHIHYDAVYIDADHHESEQSYLKQVGKKRYVNHTKSETFDFDDHLESRNFAYAIVNGNHYPASKQIIVINDAKKDSLYRRVDQLTNIDVVIVEDTSKIYDFVREKMNEQTKIIAPTQLHQLYDYINKVIQNALPPVKALVLAGGASKRMGTDKSQIHYHQKPQELFTAELCKSLGLETYISKSDQFTASKIEEFVVIKDTFYDLGPMGAILSAFRHDPNAAWLVLACDLPLLTKNSIEELLNHRNVNKVATSYVKTTEDFPEPLVSIYEPRAYGRLLEFLSIGYSCPRKMLINSDVEKVAIGNTEELMNANDPADRKWIESKLQTNGSV